MKTVCPANQCTGCRACEIRCPKAAVNFKDNLDVVYEEIEEELCIKCGLCVKVCQYYNPVVKNLPIAWHQGWANKDTVRKSSSSGGIAAAITDAFIKSGGYVCSCMFSNGEFIFKATDKLEEAQKFVGSKYVKTDPSEAYKTVDDLLSKNERVLFIGLPCQVAALKNFIPERKHEKLFCIDLICHGTPSFNLLNVYLKQNKVDIHDLKDIKFRTKGRMGINIRSITPEGAVDRYMISFLNGLNYTECCYECTYASQERVSDITLGDNWGTEYKNEMTKGISLILCMTNKGKELLNTSDVKLMNVDIEHAVNANGQLVHSSTKPDKRDYFFKRIKNNENYNKLIFGIYPQQCLRQVIKAAAVKFKIMNRGDIE